MKILNNETFWDEHYLNGGNSGKGSRGVFKEIKKSIIKYFIETFNCNSVADFGCGDCEVIEGIEIKDYTGFDGSMEIIGSNLIKFPLYKFIYGDVATLDDIKKDMTLCLDVLIHQNNGDLFRAILRNVLNAAEKVALISVARTNAETNWMFFYHNPYEVIKKLCPGALIQKVCIFRDTEIIAVIKGGKNE